MSTQPPIAFRATIGLGGKTATGIEVALDNEPREADFALALAADEHARQAFSPSS